MTRVVARLLVSLVCVPTTVVLCVLIALVMDELRWLSENAAIMLVVSAGPLLCIGAWALVWRGVIRWTRRRRLGSLAVVCSAATLDLALGVSIFVWGSWRIRDWQPMVTMSSLLVGAAAAITCLWIWMETPRERLERLRRVGVGVRVCPACRYDMSGLTNLLCPECGTEYTLGRLADEHQRAAAPADFD